MIERRNILELIGKHRRKYHSCVLTCYGLDFSFFEERVLPTLRMADIKNVNVYADGHYLEKALEATTGKEFKHNKTYNFQPIYEKGVFHPKIMLLTGVKHGLLIIGSGNMTSSGLSTNDEIWGAFHLDNLENENAPLFGAVWKYLQPYLDKSLGFIPQKIEWMRKYSPWLADLPIADSWINLKSLGMQLKFIGNTDQSGTFNQLIDSVPNKKVEELIIISPFYDRSGKQLIQLKEHFKPKQMKCLVEPNSGLLPTGASIKQINFYNWADCKRDYEETYNRLHAKLINIRLKNEEYLLVGSANITVAAMGTLRSPAANAEAGILLKRTLKEKNWIEELKIRIPKTAIELLQPANLGFDVESTPRVNYKYRILYSELRANEITIHLNKNCIEELNIIVLDRSDIYLENSLKVIQDDVIVVQTLDPESVFKVTLVKDESRISNYSLVHRFEALLRCNPDPTQEKLDAMMEEEFPDSEGITELLQYVDYNWADDEVAGTEKVFNKGVPGMREADSKDQIQEYQVLNAKEFNKPSAKSLLKQSGELTNSTVKIAEFLNLYSSGVFGKDDDFQESEEQKLYEDVYQEGEGDEADNRSSNRTQGSKEKAALIKYFRKLDDIYTKRLSEFLETQALTEVPKNLITIRSLSSILIALHLIQLKYGKKFTVLIQENKAHNSNTIKEAYIYSGGIDNCVDSLKGFLLNVLSKFLLLSGAGSKHYDFDILNQKLNRSQNLLLVKSTCLILNTPWLKSECGHRDVLLLNCLYFSIGEMILDEKIAADFVNKLNEFNIKANYVISEFNEQLENFKNEIFPNYLKWINKFTDKDIGRNTLIRPTSDLKYGNIIFNSKIGFNIVKKITPDKSRFRLDLSRAGYPFIDGEFELEQIQFGSKIILYS